MLHEDKTINHHLSWRQIELCSVNTLFTSVFFFKKKEKKRKLAFLEGV